MLFLKVFMIMFFNSLLEKVIGIFLEFFYFFCSLTFLLKSRFMMEFWSFLFMEYWVVRSWVTELFKLFLFKSRVKLSTLLKLVVNLFLRLFVDGLLLGSSSSITSFFLRNLFIGMFIFVRELELSLNQAFSFADLEWIKFFRFLNLFPSFSVYCEALY